MASALLGERFETHLFQLSINWILNDFKSLRIAVERDELISSKDVLSLAPGTYSLALLFAIAEDDEVGLWNQARNLLLGDQAS